MEPATTSNQVFTLIRQDGNPYRYGINMNRDLVSNQVGDDIAAVTNFASSSNEENVALVFGDKKLYVHKEKLMAVLPVFKAKLGHNFKEGSMNEISLPKKDINHFSRFLRYLFPEFDDELTEDTVHLILPLANEYMTEDLKKRIDEFLSRIITSEQEPISSEQIMINILGAEFYTLPNFLDACIQVASQKMFHNLKQSPEFWKISEKTLLKISLTRWEEIDKIYTHAIKGKLPSIANQRDIISLYSKNESDTITDIYQQFRLHMQEN